MKTFKSFRICFIAIVCFFLSTVLMYSFSVLRPAKNGEDTDGIKNKGTLYSNLSHIDILSWFEIHRKLGIDRVYGYVTDDLNHPARLVLGYYQRLGIFEPISYPLPGKVSVMYHDTRKCWNFQGVTNYDSQVRLQGYDYLLSFDSDEYLIPTQKNETIKQLFPIVEVYCESNVRQLCLEIEDGPVFGTASLYPDWDKYYYANRLFATYPNAAGFVFRTYLLIKDWGAQTNSPFSVERYLQRSDPSGFAAKHVVRPERVIMGRVYAHIFKAKAGYKRYLARTTDAAIYHFRRCRENWLKERPEYCLNMTRTRDTSVSELFQTVKMDTDVMKAINQLIDGKA